MRLPLKCFLALILFCLLMPVNATWAGQQVYISESPNGKYRVLIEQVIERRVGDTVFFRYPITLENTKNLRRRFEIKDASNPLVQETDKKTFKVRWDGGDSKELSSIHFNWSPDSLRFFMGVEVIKGLWRTYFVDVNNGKTTDVTADFEQSLVGKSEKWDCEKPRTQFVKWVKPHLAFLKLTSVCGKEKKKLNRKLFYLRDSVLFDTLKAEVVSRCLDCEDEGASVKFETYFRGTIPTPTPTPEETPVNQ